MSNRDRESLVSINLERQCLASLLEYEDVFHEFEYFLSDKDFSHPFHKACFCLVRDAYLSKQKIDSVVLSQKLNNLGLTKFEELDTYSYIETLSFNRLGSKEATKEYLHELHKLYELRVLLEQNEKTRQFILENKNKPLDVIFSEVDRINNAIVTKISNIKDKGVNIFETMEQNIEANAANPPQDFWQGPFKTVNRIFGSITIPSNITLIGARTGANKTNLALFYGLHLATKYSLPVIYLDYGELNISSIQHRCATMLMDEFVPYHKIVRGTWANNAEYAHAVRKIWKKVHKLKLVYYDVGNLNPKEIISLIRRAYYSQIGRGNNCLLIYDYLKPFDHNPQQSDWQMMSLFAKDLKTLINNEIPIPAWMSIQMNRLGITNNKKSINVDDSENTLQVDRVLHNASLGFLLRMKTTDELLEENNMFGNLKMIPVKHREILGDDYQAAFRPVRMIDGSFRRNYINLNMHNFHFEDKGDLNMMVEHMKNQVNVTTDTSPTPEI